VCSVETLPMVDCLLFESCWYLVWLIRQAWNWRRCFTEMSVEFYRCTPLRIPGDRILYNHCITVICYWSFQLFLVFHSARIFTEYLLGYCSCFDEKIYVFINIVWPAFIYILSPLLRPTRASVIICIETPFSQKMWLPTKIDSFDFPFLVFRQLRNAYCMHFCYCLY
jgi:hypothetical protein